MVGVCPMNWTLKFSRCKKQINCFIRPIIPRGFWVYFVNLLLYLLYTNSTSSFSWLFNEKYSTLFSLVLSHNRTTHVTSVTHLVTTFPSHRVLYTRLYLTLLYTNDWRLSLQTWSSLTNKSREKTQKKIHVTLIDFDSISIINSLFIKI